MSGERTDAEVFFGATSGAARAGAPESPTEPAAETPAPAIVTDDDLADAMFGDSLVRDFRMQIADDVNRMTDAHGWTGEDADRYVASAAQALQDGRIPAGQRATIHAHVTSAVLSPVDNATVRAWETESRKLIRERWGLEDGSRRLSMFQSFLKERPEVKELLDVSGCIWKPAVLLPFLESVHSARMVPRARKK